MVKTNSRKILAVIIALIMALSVTQLVSFADEKATAEVEFSFYNGEFVIPPVTLTVEEGLAKQYGFNVAETDHNGVTVNGITAFDVLVAAHIYKYGEAFTAETAADYITFNGYVSKAFGVNGYPSFTVNGKTPHDDIYVETSWSNGYTGYAFDTATVKSGDTEMVYFNADPGYLDYNASLDATDYAAAAGNEITVSVTGVCFTYYGCSLQEDIDKETKPMEGATVSITKDFETLTEVAIVDKDGFATFSVAEPGSYYIVVTGECETEDIDLPVIGTYANLTITSPAKTHKATFMADGNVVSTVEFEEGATSIEEPEVPAKEGFTGSWSEYTLGEADITIEAIYEEETSPEPEDLCPLDGKDHGDNFFGKIVRFLHNIIFRVISLFNLPA